MDGIKNLSESIVSLKNSREIQKFFSELFTEAELTDLSKRWQILKLLNEGVTQREIAKRLSVSLCKVTRGAKIIKNKKNIVARLMQKG